MNTDILIDAGAMDADCGQRRRNPADQSSAGFENT
jgi:hypothetical protein